jgi:hypothetical protein
MPHFARCTMIGPATRVVPHTERTPESAGAAGAGLVTGDFVRVLITG